MDRNGLPAEVKQAVDVLSREAGDTGDDASGSGATGDHDEVVAASAKLLADALRTEQLRTAVGETDIASSCARLLRARPRRAPGTQLLRLLGNLCFEHDQNRQRILDAGAIDAAVDALARHIGLSPPTVPDDDRVPISPRDLDLTFLRAGTGALLNVSLKYPPVCTALYRSPKALTLLAALVDARDFSPLRTSPSIYSPNVWAPSASTQELQEDWHDRVLLGASIVSWAMNILEHVLEERDDSSLAPPLIVPALASIPIVTEKRWNAALASPPSFDPSDLDTLVDTDLDLLTSATSLLEALVTSADLFRHALAFDDYKSTSLPTSADSLLSHLFEFVHRAKPPLSWSLVPEPSSDVDGASDDDRGARLSRAKSAVIRALVDCPNSDEVMGAFFDPVARHWVLDHLVSWIANPESDRDDLLICATHMLAAFARKDENCIALVSLYQVLPPLATLLRRAIPAQLNRTGRPGETTQLLFGAVSLLRHLAIAQSNKTPIGHEGVINLIAPLLDPSLDLVAPLQVSVIGLFKHLTASNLPNAIDFVGLFSLHRSSTTTPPALDATLALVSRTDDNRLRSEGTRAVNNAVKVLFSSIASSPLDRRARARLVNASVVDALSALVRRSSADTKFSVLFNEGVVGLTLVAGSGIDGTRFVLASLVRKHESVPDPALTDPLQNDDGDIKTPPPTREPQPPASAFDVLIASLELTAIAMEKDSLLNTKNEATTPDADADATARGVAFYRPEVVSNVCTLFLTLVTREREEREAVAVTPNHPSHSGSASMSNSGPEVEQAIREPEGAEEPGIDMVWCKAARFLERIEAAIATAEGQAVTQSVPQILPDGAAERGAGEGVNRNTVRGESGGTGADGAREGVAGASANASWSSSAVRSTLLATIRALKGHRTMDK